VFAQEPAAAPAPAPAPAEPGPHNTFFNGKLPDAIGRSKVSINSRLRWEHAEQDNLDASDALTLRTRFGITTAPLYGFQGMIEGENLTALGLEDNYNAAGSNGQGQRTPVADPETTELNQAWISYSYTNYASVKVGRQQLNVDNVRFIGDVGWRQNNQTFDAVTAKAQPVKGLDLLYSYLWEVNRIFGDVEGLPAGFTDFDSDSHAFHASYAAHKYVRITGYAYLLDLVNDLTANQSCATYGGFVNGTVPVHEKVGLSYRGEFALQSDYADSTQDYDTEYSNLELGVNVKPVTVGGGYEVLGSDNNVGFRTPLATLHAFNGWADVFLNTPGAGLRDWYAFVAVTLPAVQMPLRFVYHKFDADTGGADFGQEFDVVLSKKLGKNWTALAKYAFYDGEDGVPGGIPVDVNVQKFWLQMEFNY
jgi:hypothetical protein